MMNIINLGAGVQSSTMALMAAHGEITPMPDCAIFADTQSEPKAVYTWLDWLEKQLPFPVHRITAGSLENQLLGGIGQKRHGRPPAFVLNTDGSTGMLRRQCTGDFKIDPIHRKVRELIGLKFRQRAPKQLTVVQWIGISTDESHRIKESKKPYISHRWPLLELSKSRADCLKWMGAKGYALPVKSTCVFCPFHDGAMWRELKNNDPDSFARAVVVDEAIRNSLGTGKAFLHRSCIPLEQVDFRSKEDAGQLGMFDEAGFNLECEGMCGI